MDKNSEEQSRENILLDLLVEDPENDDYRKKLIIVWRDQGSTGTDIYFNELVTKAHEAKLEQMIEDQPDELKFRAKLIGLYLRNNRVEEAFKYCTRVEENRSVAVTREWAGCVVQTCNKYRVRKYFNMLKAKCALCSWPL